MESERHDLKLLEHGYVDGTLYNVHVLHHEGEQKKMFHLPEKVTKKNNIRKIIQKY